jgi:hypothetical protein
VAPLTLLGRWTVSIEAMGRSSPDSRPSRRDDAGGCPANRSGSRDAATVFVRRNSASDLLRHPSGDREARSFARRYARAETTSHDAVGSQRTTSRSTHSGLARHPRGTKHSLTACIAPTPRRPPPFEARTATPRRTAVGRSKLSSAYPGLPPRKLEKTIVGGKDG